MGRKTALLVFFVLNCIACGVACVKTEKWDIFELTLKGPAEGNPFVDVQLGAEFKQGGDVFRPQGFYDGDSSDHDGAYTAILRKI